MLKVSFLYYGKEKPSVVLYLLSITSFTWFSTHILHRGKRHRSSLPPSTSGQDHAVMTWWWTGPLISLYLCSKSIFIKRWSPPCFLQATTTVTATLQDPPDDDLLGQSVGHPRHRLGRQEALPARLPWTTGHLLGLLPLLAVGDVYRNKYQMFMDILYMCILDSIKYSCHCLNVEELSV